MNIKNNYVIYAFTLLLIGIQMLVFDAHAQTGVSDDRVSLPEGPGSIDGFSDNATVSDNMGMMSYSIPIKVPQGFPAATPNLSFSYSSATGSTFSGMGWNVNIPYIERMTSKGLPEYDRDDMFAVSGSSQLVYLPGSSPAEYRLRFEGDFIRYRWHDTGDGTEGYWTSEQPDGTVSYYGADSSGTLVDSSRFGKAGVGTFRYYLYETVDVFGHKIRYTYESSKNVASAFEPVPVPLIRKIGYVYGSGNTPKYSIDFTYELRKDLISDCKAGYNEVLGERLTEVKVSSSGTQLIRYILNYDTESETGGISRLSSISMRGISDTAHPVKYSFDYSKALGNLCQDSTCESPYLVEMGSIGVNLAAGNATLLDINGDALPDIVDTQSTAAHKFFISHMNKDSVLTFGTGTDSLYGGSMQLSSAYVQVLDVNGDGYADIFSSATHKALINKGNGDWEGLEDLFGTGVGDSLPDFGEDFGGGDDNLENIRFMDYDNDKKIDVVRSLADSTTIYRNMGSQGFLNDPDVESIGAGFASDNLQLSDMNVDGLLDPLLLFDGGIKYKLNLGWGHWSDWQTVDGVSITSAEIPFVELEDLNGDSLSDLVIVQGDTVRYSINRNGASFDAFEPVQTVSNGSIPDRTSDVTVLYADMNGNGSSDIVWIDASGKVTFLELFPVRPNLISKIENNLGMVTEITYKSSVEQRAKSDVTWDYTLPHAMTVVDSMDVSDNLSGVHEVKSFEYQDGYYDGDEKQFRGFAYAEISMAGDEYQESGLWINTYEVGATDSYRYGLLTTQDVYSDERNLASYEFTYDDCEVGGLPKGVTLSDPVRYICKTAEEKVIKEGLAKDKWVTTSKSIEYDSYGNQTRVVDNGVVSIGGGACGVCNAGSSMPCGKNCTGDELVDEVLYIAPKNKTGGWLLRSPYKEMSYSPDDTELKSETSFYYDGDDFKGLALTEIDKGLVSKVVKKKNTNGETVTTERNSYDADGNLLVEIDPLGSIGGTSHQIKREYDSDGLNIVKSIVMLDDKTLSREYTYDALWGEMSGSRSWALDGEQGDVTSYGFDELDRLVYIAKPGDSKYAPTLEMVHSYSDPVSTIISKRRTVAGEDADLEAVQCFDGKGRLVQERTLIKKGEYLVTGFTKYNNMGSKVELFQPYTSTSAKCDENVPSGVLSTKYKFDAAFRTVSFTISDEGIYKTSSTARYEYEPLKTYKYDFEDNDKNSDFFNTPTIETVDGLGRIVQMERKLDDKQTADYYLKYDGLGRLVSYEDAGKNVKEMEYDLLDNVVLVDDPNSGITTFQYDDADNLVVKTDANGKTVINTYDGANRPVATYDPEDKQGTLITRVYDLSSDCKNCKNGEGNIVRVTYPADGLGDGIDEFNYDKKGMLKDFARTLDGFKYETAYTYDNAMRRIQVLNPDSSKIDYSYDGASRITGITNIVDAIEYDEKGLLKSVAFANGVDEQIGYDEIGRLTSKSVLFNKSVYQGMTIERSRIGNITSRTDVSDAADSAPLFTNSYSYDSWYRVLIAELEGVDDSKETVSYAYDLMDNITSRTSSLGKSSKANVGDYAYDANHPNAAIEAGSIVMKYDMAGQMISRGANTLNWDYMGRLDSVETGGNVTGNFVYGSNNMRVAKLEDGGAVLYITEEFEVRDGIGTSYARFGKNKIHRHQKTDFQTAVYSDIAPAGDLDGVITSGDAYVASLSTKASDEEVDRLLKASARRFLVENTLDDVYLHSDDLGSITLATAGDGKVAGERVFYPDGEVRYSNGYVDDYGFTGQELDMSSGLTHFENRYLDTGIGRWISFDPSFTIVSPDALANMADAFSGYGYVGNNFINNYDSTGLSSETGFIKKATGWQGTVTAGAGNIALGIGRLAFGDVAGLMNIGTGVTGLVSGKVERMNKHLSVKDKGITKVFKNTQRLATGVGLVLGGAAVIAAITVLSGGTVPAAIAVVAAIGKITAVAIGVPVVGILASIGKTLSRKFNNRKKQVHKLPGMTSKNGRKQIQKARAGHTPVAHHG
ncbi:MAG: hypothetical protein JXR91_07085 [Deltaproteobacteria bacterium]|nr:hypothetical protein [Deltaproteobacteria bacterium]